MSYLDKDLALQQTLDDVCEARDAAIRDFSAALRLIDSARGNLSVIAPHIMPYLGSGFPSEEVFTKDVDRRLWQIVWDKTHLSQYMDKKAREEMHRSLEKDPPAMTLENARTALLSAASQADLFFARGVHELFRTRNDYDYETNKAYPFRLGEKMVLDGAVDVWFLPKKTWSHRMSDRLNDVDRVFKTLDQVVFAPRTLEAAINAAWASSDTFEDGYYKIRGFKKGTAHIWFKRHDLLEKVNKVIADYAGPVLGNDRRHP